MECPACHFKQPEGNTSCEACGLIFAKYNPDAVKPNPSDGPSPSYPMGKIKTSLPGSGHRLRWRNPFFYVSNVFLIFVIYTTVSRLSFIDRALHAPGEILEITYKPSAGRKGGTYMPKVQYTLPDGQVRVEIDKNGMFSFMMPAVGEKVDVLYDPDKPDNFRINSFVFLWFGIILFTVILVPFLFIGWYPFFVN